MRWREGLCSFIGRAGTPFWSETGKSERCERSPARRAVLDRPGSAEMPGGNGESAGSGVSSVRTPAAKPCGGMDSDRGPISSAVQFATRRRRAFRIRTTALQSTRTWRGRKQPDAIPIRAQGRPVGILARFIVCGKPQTREFWGRSPGFGGTSGGGMRRTTFAAPAVSPDRRSSDEAEWSLTRLDRDLCLGKSVPSRCSSTASFALMRPGTADESPASRS